jgi:hypothetical protein
MKRPAALLWALAFIFLSGPAVSQAAPRSRKAPNAADSQAKEMDVLKALDDKQIQVQVVANSISSAVMTLTNVSETPLNVKVPLALAAVPEPAPQGVGQGYYTAAFGTLSAPQPLAIAVSPLGAAGVSKKAGTRKTNVKANKKPKAGDDAKEEKKDDEKDGKKDEEKKTDSLEASVLLLPGASHQLSLFTLGLDSKKQQAAYGPFQLAELDKVSQAPELKKLLELMVQGTIPRNTAQVLAWHYHGRLSWDELAASGVTPVDLEAAKQYAGVVEGTAPADPVPTTGKKKKR